MRAAIDWYKENGITQTFTHLKQEEAKDADGLAHWRDWFQRRASNANSSP